MIRMIVSKFQELGPLRVAGAAYKFLFNTVLQKIYGFDRWHVNGNYYSRPYKARVIALAERVQPTSVVEIGAGLGDIIGRVKAEIRVGLDLDPHVIAAARHCVPPDVRLASANFLEPESVEAALKNAFADGQALKAIDCLILVNWIHMVDIEAIAASIAHISRVYPIRFIVVDAIKPDLSGYRYHHDEAAFSILGQIEAVEKGDSARDLILIRRQASQSA